jgi:hypothetical protein
MLDNISISVIFAWKVNFALFSQEQENTHVHNLYTSAYFFSVEIIN